MKIKKITRTDCNCESCIRACKYRPGWFKFGEIGRVAKFLKTTTAKLFKQYLCVDWYYGKHFGDDVFIVAPAVIGHEGGMSPYNPRGRCVFLTDDDKCLIHPVKPFECAIYDHDMKFETMQKEHGMVAQTWDGDRQRKHVRRLLGYEPYAPAPGIIDMVALPF